MNLKDERLPASFRDPSGFLFRREGELYRQVNQSYRRDYDLLLSSGLYDRLVKAGLLIRHEEAAVEPADPVLAYKVIRPQPVSFISYPYEWSFSQLKDAALLTLSLAKKALAAGMALKDASAYNIQLMGGKPVLIDTLSFEIYQPGQPWIAYRQFCQHFLAPLALMAHKDVRLGQLLRIYIDGIPLDLASALLPWRTRLNSGLAMHLHLHAAAQKKYSQSASRAPIQKGAFSQMAFQGLLESLESCVRALKWQPEGSEWGDYYDATNYTAAAFEAKKQLVRELLQPANPQVVWDLGANTGVFSRVAAENAALVVSADIDPAAVEKNYRQVRKDKEKNLLPLLVDLTNPSPAIGWRSQERQSLLERGPADAVLALALVHHLAIGNNVPLPDLAAFFASLGRWLLVEFVPKQDSQVQRLLASRADIFPDYTPEGFERAFEPFFSLRDKRSVEGSQRTLYWMERK